MSSDDEEIKRINERKMQEIMARNKQENAGRKPLVLSDASFTNEISRHELIVVDFWAAWCGPCRMIAPVIEQLASEYSGRVAFGKLNVDENPLTSERFGVQSIPMLLVFKNGKQVDGIVGAVPKAVIESKFKPYLTGGNQVYH